MPAALLALLLAIACGKLLMAQERSLQGIMQALLALCHTAPDLKHVDMQSVICGPYAICMRVLI